MAGRITFVSAGAGSGKTYWLTQILHEKLSSKQVSPSGVMATTFTRKAATELRERVRTALLENGEVTLANSMGQARIGTVNSVCRGLLERFAFEAGLAPVQRVLEEAQAGALVREALDAVSDTETLQRINSPARRLGIDDWDEKLKLLIDLARANDIAPDRCANKPLFMRFLGVLEGLNLFSRPARSAAPSPLQTNLRLTWRLCIAFLLWSLRIKPL